MKNTSHNMSNTQLMACCRYVKPVIYVASICAICILFSLPIIFYYVTADLHSTIGATNFNLTITNEANETCTPSTRSRGVANVDGASVACEPYSGSVCRPYLKQWQACVLPGNSDVNIAVDRETQEVIEKELLNFFNQLKSVPECRTLAMPLLCHYYYPLIDCQQLSVGSTNGNSSTVVSVYTVTQENCNEITDTVCAAAWQVAIILGNGDKLPNCNTLPNRNNSIDKGGTMDADNKYHEVVSNDSLISFNDITCKDDFILIGNTTCFPRCDQFEENPHASVTFRVYTETIASGFAGIVSAITITASIYNRKRMFKFPSFFLLFLAVDIFISCTMFITIEIANRYKLFCSSVNLIEVYSNPTITCKITGALWHYLTFHFCIWWFFHMCVFFFEIMFPFQAQQMRQLGQTKYLAAILVPLGMVIPLPGVIVSLAKKELQYTSAASPPTAACTPFTVVWFYSENLHICILLAIGTSLLITILWKIHMSFSKQKREKRKLTDVEKKLIFASLCYILLGAYFMTFFAVSHGDSGRAREGLMEYFLCESTGHVPGKCSRSSFEPYIHTELVGLGNLCLGLISIAILNFVVSWEEVWKSTLGRLKCIKKGKTIKSQSSLSTIKTLDRTSKPSRLMLMKDRQDTALTIVSP